MCSHKGYPIHENFGQTPFLRDNFQIIFNITKKTKNILPLRLGKEKSK
jgi:hypothetical protein